MKAIFSTVLFFAAFGLALPSWAIPVPLRDPGKLPGQTQTVAYPVKTAKVILADYELLRRDFPTLLKNLSSQQIDAWLVKNAALISHSQLELGEKANTNSYIDANPSKPVLVYRPRDYGRGFVLSVGKNKKETLLIDAKGVGAEEPSLKSGHSNGLGGLDEMVLEYAFEKLVHKIFVHSKSRFDTIETYAVLDMGFKANISITWNDAGVVLRQAHVRYKPSLDHNVKYYNYQLPDPMALEIEKILRRYGVTSTGIKYMMDFGRRESRFQNIQGTEEGAVVDFGPYMAVAQFDASLAGAKYDDQDQVRILMDIHSPEFVQPDPALRVSLSRWGIVYDSWQNRIRHHPSEWANQWLEWIHEGIKTKEEFASFLHNLYQEEQFRWNSASHASGEDSQ